MRVQKSTGSNLNNLKSEVGSIKRQRFTGWKEQEKGTRPERTRSITRFARGSKNRKLRAGFRMKSGAGFLDSDDLNIQGSGDRTAVMLQILARRKERKPFIIKNSRTFRSGLYVLRRKKAKRIQTFKQTKKIKRVSWLEGGRREFFRTSDIDRIWADNLRRVLRF